MPLALQPASGKGSIALNRPGSSHSPSPSLILGCSPTGSVPALPEPPWQSQHPQAQPAVFSPVLKLAHFCLAESCHQLRGQGRLKQSPGSSLWGFPVSPFLARGSRAEKAPGLKLRAWFCSNVEGTSHKAHKETNRKSEGNYLWMIYVCGQGGEGSQCLCPQSRARRSEQ